jgi:hypothetical protein
LLGTLDSNGSVLGKLVLKRRKGKKRDIAADFQINFYVEGLIEKDVKPESAVAEAEAKFGLSRNAIYEARARIKLLHKEPLPDFPGFPFLHPRGD